MAGYRHCITESSAERQRQFETALQALMEQTPMAQISVQDICDRVGLSRKSFYRYFSSKEDCICALIDHTILDLMDFPTHEDHIQQITLGFFAFWGQHRKFLDGLYRNNLTSLLIERAVCCAAQEYGIREDAPRTSADYARTVFFISGMMGVLLDWHLSGYQKTPAQLTADLAAFYPPYSHGVF